MLTILAASKMTNDNSGETRTALYRLQVTQDKRGDSTLSVHNAIQVMKVFHAWKKAS